jgi:hypothetical protein
MILFFEADTQTYEAVRRQLDEAAGYPLADGSTLTSMEPAESAPRSADGLVLFALGSEMWNPAYAAFRQISQDEYIQKRA